MLHIILGILKLAGILIGVLFLLLLAVILAVLLVPVRYRLRAVKEDGTLDAEMKVSWLFHLASAAVSIGNGKKLSITVRLFGRRLPFFQDRAGGGQKRRTSSGKKKRNSQRQKNRKNAGDDDNRPGNLKSTKPEFTDSAGNTERNISDAGQQQENTDPVRDTGQQLEDPDSVRDTGKQPEDPKPVRGPGQQETAAQTEEAGWQDKTEQADPGKDTWPNPPEDPAAAKKNRWQDGADIGGKLQNMRFKVRRICDKIKQISEKIRKLFLAAVSIPEKLQRLAEKLGELFQKPSMLLALMEKYEIWDILKKLKGEMAYLLRHCGPRRIWGYLDFGAGDPAMTGQLTGVIYMLLPARAEDFSVRPDFYEAGLETEIMCSGHIRGIHFVCTALRTLKDRRVRRLIRRFIKKGE